jgi:hypothetical protein
MQCDAEQTLQRARQLQREVEEGNTEYKYKLVSPSAERIQHLATQLNWYGSPCPAACLSADAVVVLLFGRRAGD